MESLAKAQHAARSIAVIAPFEAKTLTKDGAIGFADVIYPVPADEIDDARATSSPTSPEPARDAGPAGRVRRRLVAEESRPAPRAWA